MECATGNQAVRRFRNRSFASAALVVLFAFVAAALFRLLHLHGVVAYAVAILPALHVEYLLWGIGGTLGLTTVWGYLEDFVQVRRLDLIYIYPIFWLFVAIAMPVVRRKYR